MFSLLSINIITLWDNIMMQLIFMMTLLFLSSSLWKNVTLILCRLKLLCLLVMFFFHCHKTLWLVSILASFLASTITFSVFFIIFWTKLMLFHGMALLMPLFASLSKSWFYFGRLLASQLVSQLASLLASQLASQLTSQLASLMSMSD